MDWGFFCFFFCCRWREYDSGLQSQKHTMYLYLKFPSSTIGVKSLCEDRVLAVRDDLLSSWFQPSGLCKEELE
jgi:hypothetical protein